MDTDLNGTHSGFPEYNDDKVTENSGGVNANVLMEILGPALTVVAVVAYQAFVGGAAARKRAMDRPTGRVGRNRIRFFMGSVRLQWIKRVLSGDLAASVAVNTLREDMRAAVFLASTSMIVGIGTIGFAMSQFPVCLSNVVVLRSSGDEGVTAECNFAVAFVVVKLFLEAAVWIAAFLNFALTVRHIGHAAYLITAKHVADGVPVHPRVVSRFFHRFVTHRRMGMRCIYHAPLPLLWIFSPVALLVGTAPLIVLLYYHDHLAVAEELVTLSPSEAGSDVGDIEAAVAAPEVGAVSAAASSTALLRDTALPSTEEKASVSRTSTGRGGQA